MMFFSASLSSVVLLSEPIQWFGESAFDRPFAPVNAAFKGMEWNTVLFGPLSHRFSFVVENKKSIGALIVALLFVGSPSTIFRAVPLGVINAIYSMFRARFWPHVGYKIFVNKPSITHAKSNVFGEFRIWRAASPDHLAPISVDIRAPSSIGCASFVLAIIHAACSAAAAFYFAANKSLSKNNMKIAAFALTIPFSPFFRSRIPPANGGKPVEFSAGKINSAWHIASSCSLLILRRDPFYVNRGLV